MAKKNLSSLMEGIIGTEMAEPIETAPAPKATPAATPEATPAAKHASKPAKKSSAPAEKGKPTTVVLDADLYRKAKVLSLVMNQSLKTTICQALADYIAAHESELSHIKL